MVTLFIAVGVLLAVMLPVLGTTAVVDCESFGDVTTVVTSVGQQNTVTIVTPGELISGKAFELFRERDWDLSVVQDGDEVTVTSDHILVGSSFTSIGLFNGSQGLIANNVTFPLVYDLNEWSIGDHFRVHDTGAPSNVRSDQYKVYQEQDAYWVGNTTTTITSSNGTGVTTTTTTEGSSEWKKVCETVQGESIRGSSLLVLILIVVAAIAVIGTLRLMS